MIGVSLKQITCGKMLCRARSCRIRTWLPRSELRFCRTGRSRWSPPLHPLNDHKQDECYDQELEDILDKCAVCKYSGSFRPCGGKALVRSPIQRNKKICKVDLAGCQRDDRHNDIVNKRTDDRVEGSADDDTDCHIHDIAAHNEFFEFTDHSHKTQLPSVLHARNSVKPSISWNEASFHDKMR